MEFEKLLRLMVEKGGSDLFITAGVPPSMKVNGKIMPVTKNAMSPEMTRETVLGVMNEAQRREFAAPFGDEGVLVVLRGLVFGHGGVFVRVLRMALRERLTSHSAAENPPRWLLCRKSSRLKPLLQSA